VDSAQLAGAARHVPIYQVWKNVNARLRTDLAIFRETLIEQAERGRLLHILPGVLRYIPLNGQTHDRIVSPVVDSGQVCLATPREFSLHPLRRDLARLWKRTMCRLAWETACAGPSPMPTMKRPVAELETAG